MGAAQSITVDNFDAEVLQSDIPVLVDFWSVTCGPCRAIAPTIDQLAVEYAGRAKIVKVDITDNMDLVTRYGVGAVPTLLYFKGGDVVNGRVGAQSKEKIEAALDECLQNRRC